MDPIKWRTKIILAGIEDNYAVDSNPTGAANAMLMTDVELKPMEGEDVSRNLERPYLGAQENIAAGLHVVLTGSVELVGSGTLGDAPAWGPLLRACGVAEVMTAATKVEYTPVSEGHESASLYFWVGPTRHIMKGTRGTCTITVNAQKIPVAKFTLTGLFTLPGDQVRPVVDLSAFQVPQIASNANTPTFSVGAVDMVLREFSLNIGNDVQRRLLIGREEILITDRAEQIAARVEALPMATFNPFDNAMNNTRLPVVLDHGTVAGRKFNFTAPTATLARLSGYENDQNVLEWPLSLSPQPTAGDDQWTITLT